MKVRAVVKGQQQTTDTDSERTGLCYQSLQSLNFLSIYFFLISSVQSDALNWITVGGNRGEAFWEQLLNLTK